jgi:hypothetical protein
MTLELFWLTVELLFVLCMGSKNSALTPKSNKIQHLLIMLSLKITISDLIDEIGVFCSASPIPEQIHGVAICRRRDQVHIDLCGPAYGTFCRSRGFTLPGKELTLEAKLHRSHRVKSSEAVHRSWFRTLNHQKDRLLSSPKGIGWDWWWGSRDHMKMSVVLKGFVFLETPHLRLAQLFVLARRTLHYIHVCN